MTTKITDVWAVKGITTKSPPARTHAGVHPFGPLSSGKGAGPTSTEPVLKEPEDPKSNLKFKGKSVWRQSFSLLVLIATRISWGLRAGCVLREARLRQHTPGAPTLQDEPSLSGCIHWILTSCGLMEFISECPLAIGASPRWFLIPSETGTLNCIAHFSFLLTHSCFHSLTHLFHKSLFRPFYILLTAFVPEVDLDQSSTEWISVLPDFHAPSSQTSMSPLKVEGFLQLEGEGKVRLKAQEGFDLILLTWRCRGHVARNVGDLQKLSGPHLKASKKMRSSIL